MRRAPVERGQKRASPLTQVQQTRGENSMKALLVRLVREDEGQDLVEYALLITFIALACIVGMQQLGTAINNRYNSISSSLAS
jgi:pilus assembly protein Flp/PilA